MKKREGSRFIDSRIDNKGRLLCLIPTCNKLRQKYKTTDNTRNYCEDHTFWDMGEFTNWATIREKVLKRDNYTCVECHRKKRSKHLCGDHIKPVALGGDEFDLENVQTLCVECHKIKTKDDMKKIAAQRRLNKLINVGQTTL